jgi:integrase
MARKTLPLDNTQIKNAKPQEKEYKLFDGGGLYILIKPNGSKGWRLKYLFERKENRLSLGVYPIVGLADARIKRDEFKKMLASGINPSDKRKENKAQIKIELAEEANSFENVANEFLEKQKLRIGEKTHEKKVGRLKNHVFGPIGAKKIDDVTIQDILLIIRKIEAKGQNETAHRILNLINQVYQYGLTVGRAKHNIAADINARLALDPIVVKHMPTIVEPTLIKQFLNGLDRYSGTLAVQTALKLMPYVALRPANIRAAEWKEFDFEKKIWRIPAEKIKMKSDHYVPLTDRMIEIVEIMKPFTGDGRYVFCTQLRGKDYPLSENTLTKGIRIVFKNEKIDADMVSHGARSMFSTLAYEHFQDHKMISEVIERQLDHRERNKIKDAYNHAEYFNERRTLMQWWSDYLDALKNQEIKDEE